MWAARYPSPGPRKRSTGAMVPFHAFALSLFLIITKMGNMAATFSLSEISTRARVDARALRYVLEHAAVPFARAAGRGRGTPRRFNQAQAFTLALSGLLFGSGLRRSTTAALAGQLMTRLFSDVTGDFDPVARDAESFVEVGDGLNVRTRRPGGATSVWHQIGTMAPLAVTYRPLIVVAVDAAELGRRLFDPR